jgi:hypothetical protein
MSDANPDTHTLTTPVGDELRHALALQAGLRPDSVELVAADLRDGALAVEVEGERV